MFLYLLTSKNTYSRAVVCAGNESKAKEMRPDGAFWRYDAWHSYVTVGTGFSAGPQLMKAPSLDWWPDDIQDVEALLLGRAENYVSRDVWAAESSVEPREM